MADEVLEKPGEQTPTEPVQETQETKEPEQPVQEEPGELDVLKNQFVNLEKKMGEQSAELGNLRNENAFYRNQGNQGQGQGQQPVHPQNPGVQAPTGSPVGNAPEYDPYDAESVKNYNAYQQQLTDNKLNQFAGFVGNAIQAGDAMSRVRDMVQRDPEHFKGIEQETITMVSNLAKVGTVDPNLISAEDTVYGCAAMVRDYRKRSQASPAAPITPVATTAIDTPTPVRPNEPEKQLDTGIAKEIIDTFYDGNLEEATKGARGSRDRGEK